MIRKKEGFHTVVAIGIFLFILGILSPVTAAYSAYGDEKEDKKKDLPPRAISIAPEYTGVVISKGDDVSIDITVANRGRQDEDIEMTVPSVPKGWKVWIKTYSFGVTGVHVESDTTKSLTLKAEPDKDVGPGKYVIDVKGSTRDGKFTSSGRVTLIVEEKKKDEKSKDVDITTSYPVLEGPSDAKFEFSLEVENKSDKDMIFNLIPEGPKNWDIRFKPAYEDKYFSSLRIKGNQSQSMAVEVKPFPFAEPGEYPIKVKVSSPNARGEVELKVLLTGTYKLDAGTADGLLSLNSYQGKPANLSFYVRNNGSAAQNNVRFLSFKPENWKVEFKPENIETLAPGDLKQVELTITPAEQSLVGDYSVNLSVEGEKATENLELRVTVKASTVWGWLGIGIIVIVILGMVTLFVKLGRR